MTTKVLRGSTCGSLNLPPELACDKCKCSIEKYCLTGKRNKRKIKTCERLWDTCWASNRFDYKRARHKEVVGYLNEKTVIEIMEDTNDLTNIVNSIQASEILNDIQNETTIPTQSTLPPQPSEILNNAINGATVNILDDGGGERESVSISTNT